MRDIQKAIYKVTTELLPVYKTVAGINSGGCEDWAWNVYHELEASGHAIEIWETDFAKADTAHIFLKIDGLWYDVETPHGVTNYMDLPIFKKLSRKQPAGKIVAKKGDSQRDIVSSLTPEQLKGIAENWLIDSEKEMQLVRDWLANQRIQKNTTSYAGSELVKDQKARADILRGTIPVLKRVKRHPELYLSNIDELPVLKQEISYRAAKKLK